MPPARDNAKELLDQWLDLQENGMSAKGAAEKLGVPRETLYKYKRKFLPDLTVTREEYNEDGMLVKTVKAIRENAEIDTSNMRVKGVSVSPSGGAWVKYENEVAPSVEQMREEFIESVKGHTPKYPIIDRKPIKDGHLLVVDPADIHIGKLSSPYECTEEYNMDIAIKNAKSGVEGIIQKASGFNIDKIMFVIGNDIVHTDNPQRTTTSGTRQDADGTWHEAFINARKLYVSIIETLVPVADVDCVFCPSNHDYMSGFMLADSLASWFKGAKNVSFMNSMQHRKYYSYGKSLIGVTHGDSCKEKDLGQLMSKEAKDMWGDADHCYWYLHHYHHKKALDYINCTVEYMRAVSPDDAWHNRNGYVSSPAVEGFIHSKEDGQVCRLTHYLK